MADNKPLVTIDSTSVAVIKPSETQEKELFSDGKLQYKRDVKLDPNWFDRFLNWMARLFFGDESYGNIVLARRVLIWIVVILCLGIVIWLLMRSDFSRLIKPKPKTMAFNFSELAEDLNTIDFDKMIQDAVKNENYRLAIRWHYLKTLYVLDKRQLITFVPYKTNFDYRRELTGKSVQNHFNRLSWIYERVWYGEFNIKQSDYPKFESEFKETELV